MSTIGRAYALLAAGGLTLLVLFYTTRRMPREIGSAPTRSALNH